jgi:hypothetical protein
LNFFWCESVGSCVFEFFHARSDAVDILHVLKVLFGVSHGSNT